MSADRDIGSSKRVVTPVRTDAQDVPRLSDAMVERWSSGEEVVPDGLLIPNYVRPEIRSTISVGTLMIGPGHFGRGLIGALHHQALLEGDRTSGICSINVRGDGKEVSAQNGLFILNQRQHGESTYEVVGAIVEALSMKRDLERILQRFEDEAVRCVTLSITLAGYTLDSSNGYRLDLEKVRDDIADPRNPRTSIGLLAEGIRRRYEKFCGEPGARLAESGDPLFKAKLTIIPCDNLPPLNQAYHWRGLGSFLREALIDYCSSSGQEALAAFVRQHIAIPNTQVDRICPTPSQQDFSDVTQFGVQDSLVTPTEHMPRHALVVGNHSACGDLATFDSIHTPRWLQVHQGDRVLVNDTPNEHANIKTHTLNAGHVILAWVGKYMGLDVIAIHDLMAMPAVKSLLSDVMLHSVQPTLEFPAELGGRRGFQFGKYVESVLFRFENWSLPDSIDRLDTKGTEKIRERIVSVIQKLEDRIDEAPTEVVAERLTAALVPLALIVAVWSKCVTTGVDELGTPVTTTSRKPTSSGGYQEEIKDPLAEKWRTRYPNLSDALQLEKFKQEREIFPTGIENMPRFEGIFERWIRVLETTTLSDILEVSAGKNLQHTLDTLAPVQ